MHGYTDTLIHWLKQLPRRGHCRLTTAPFYASRDLTPLRSMIPGMVTSSIGSTKLDELMFAPLACASAEHHAAIITAVCEDIFAEVQREKWFRQISALYIRISFNMQTRRRHEVRREFRALTKKILWCCFAVAGAHNPSCGQTALSTLEGLISQTARTTLPDMFNMQIIHATAKKFGSGCDKPDEKVRHVRAREHVTWWTR